MTAVATRPEEILGSLRNRHLLRHGIVSIAVANALLAGVIIVMMRLLDDVVGALGLLLVGGTTLVDVLFVTPTRIEIGADQVAVCTAARMRLYDPRGLLLRPARVGRSSVLVSTGRRTRPLARLSPSCPALADLVAAGVPIATP
jgi:hypothetical protein